MQLAAPSSTRRTILSVMWSWKSSSSTDAVHRSTALGTCAMRASFISAGVGTSVIYEKGARSHFRHGFLLLYFLGCLRSTAYLRQHLLVVYRGRTA